jgi:hypothetical protein
MADLTTITQSSFAGGMRDRDHPSLLSETEYSYGKNIDIRNAGLASTRLGTSTKTDSSGGLPQGAKFYAPVSGTAVLVVVNSGRFYFWGGSGTTWTQIGTTQLNNISKLVGICILNGRMFFFCGKDDHVYSWDGIAASLTDEGDSNTDPILGSLCAVQAGRIAASVGDVTTDGDYIYFSDIFDGQTFARSTNNKRTPTDGSEPITALATYRKEEILAFTRFSTHSWDIAGATVSGFTRNQLDVKIGCVAPRSVVVVGDDAFFLSADKQLRTIKRTAQDLAFGVMTPVTYLVPNLMERINRSYMHLAAGVFFDNYYLLAVPMDNSTTNNSVIVFDMLHQRQTPSGLVPVCVGEWTNINASDWAITYFNNRPQLYYIHSTTGKAVLMFDSLNDDGVTIPIEIQTRGYDFGAPANDKTAESGEIQIIDSQGTLTITFAKDDALYNSLISSVVGDPTTAILPVTLPFFLPGAGAVGPTRFDLYGQGQSRYWQLKFNHDGGTINIKQYTLRAFIEPYVTR